MPEPDHAVSTRAVYDHAVSTRAVYDHAVSTRAVYDHSAPFYVEHLGTELSPRFETDLDRAALDTFASELVTAGGGPVLDAGCGPGRVAAHLSRRGLEVAGIDIAPAMIAEARAAHPHLSFEIGSITAIPFDDHSLAGAVYWYSIIHTPLDQLQHVWIELRRVLSSGGRALIAFQAGSNDVVTRPDAYGSSFTLTRYQHATDDVAASLEAHGFRIDSRSQRPPALEHETTPQAIVIATAV